MKRMITLLAGLIFAMALAVPSFAGAAAPGHDIVSRPRSSHMVHRHFNRHHRHMGRARRAGFVRQGRR